MTGQHLTTLSLTQLFDQWAINAHTENAWRATLQKAPESDFAATKFATANLQRKMINAEIERRADLLEFEVVNCLIQSGTNFYFHDKQGL